MSTSELSHAAVKALADGAVRMIPPVWPLSASVAVNPFLGQAEEGLATAAARLRRVAGERLVMPRAWFAERLSNGEIEPDDLQAAIAMSASGLDIDALQVAMKADVAPFQAVPTVADLAARATGTEWPAIAADRIGQWAAAYFDEGQALWMSPRRGGAYAAWRGGAVHDLTPEIMGLPGFAQRVADAPQDPVAVIAAIMERLGIDEDAAPNYFHTLLTTLGGWAHLGRYELWQAELAAVEGAPPNTTGIELLAIRLLWEDALFDLAGDEITRDWAAARAAHAAPVAAEADDSIDATLQLAAELAAQRQLEVALASSAVRDSSNARPSVQAAFCIDVRSEVFRRALESVDGTIVTLGFAGFFGLATAHHGFASDVEERRLPVLLNPALHSHATLERDEATDRSARYLARAKRAWGRFKLAAVSSFAFVEATGPIYAFRLLRDTFGLQRRDAPGGPAPMLTPTPALADRVAAAAGILRAMSLTRDFARVVLIAGHGANVANNPHASALHCGACGGYSGEVNARLLARLLSEPDVRTALLDEGITIPNDTLFVAGLHDTTTDRVTLYDDDVDGSAHAADLVQLRTWLSKAATVACTERAIRLPGATGPSLDRRSRDWSQLRPEWGLAGCNAFIAAPRERTRGRDLAGRVFLHDYVWADDEGFGVLELIMTAPVVVASWISLQYYGSTVAPRTFGAGNKLMHNVTGGIGVLEGNGGVLRPGLPWQSVHDGTRFIHEPLRLSVMIEAPVPAMTDILSRHPGVRALFDNGWMHLLAIDESGVRNRYIGNLEWESR